MNIVKYFYKLLLYTAEVKLCIEEQEYLKTSEKRKQ